MGPPQQTLPRRRKHRIQSHTIYSAVWRLSERIDAEATWTTCNCSKLAAGKSNPFVKNYFLLFCTLWKRLHGRREYTNVEKSEGPVQRNWCPYWHTNDIVLSFTAFFQKAHRQGWELQSRFQVLNPCQPQPFITAQKWYPHRLRYPCQFPDLPCACNDTGPCGVERSAGKIMSNT